MPSLTQRLRHQRFAIFIEGLELEEAGHALNARIDFRKLREAFPDQGELLRSTYYAVTHEESYFSGRPLLDWLVYNGYTVRERTAPDTSGQRASQYARGVLAMELAIDALDLAPHLDTIIIFSGDSRFVPLVEAIKRRGPRVLAISTIKTKPALITQDLRRKVDQFLDLADLMPRIAMEPRARDCSVVP